MKIDARNLDIISKNLIEANFQGSDAGAFALAVFHRSNNLLAVLAEIAELIELGMKTCADHAGIGGQGRGRVGNGALEHFANVSELVNFVVKATKQDAASGTRRSDNKSRHATRS